MSVRWSSHPSVSQSGDTLRLKVFEYLKSDPSLPKNLVNGMVVLRKGKTMTVEEYMNSADGMSRYRREEYGCSTDSKSIFHKKPLLQRIAEWFGCSFEKKSTPPVTFENAKEMIEKNVISSEIGDMAERMKGLIEKTRQNGQVALSKRLENEHSNILHEVMLVKNGLFHYLTEDDAIKLLKKADKGIRIDFWNDYPDFVPDEVLEAKKKADSLCVFDNWCIMHYDPEGSTLKQMKAEEWRRDPILFGMVVGSDRLYFVKDWKTEKDDLTIDKVCGTLGIKNLRDARNYGVESEWGSSIDTELTNVSITPDMLAIESAVNSTDANEVPSDSEG